MLRIREISQAPTKEDALEKAFEAIKTREATIEQMAFTEDLDEPFGKKILAGWGVFGNGYDDVSVIQCGANEFYVVSITS
jgi:hypothetical protein